MKTKTVRDSSGSQEHLTHEERVTLSLLRIVVELATIRKDLKKSDFQRLPALVSFFEATDQLISEMGYSDDE